MPQANNNPPQPGLIHIYTGEGKGKTTAAVGLTIRCAGSGGRVVFCQFLKDNQSSELNILRQIPLVEIVQATPIRGFYKNLNDEQRAAARQTAGQLLRRAIAAAGAENPQPARLLVLDEAIAACNHQLIDQNELASFLRDKPAGLEVVLTGRSPAPELLTLADYVSEIRKLKHPFNQGIAARRGIEK